MKKCPHCHSDIQDNAEFCLYCMRSLDQSADAAARKKQLQWVLIFLAVVTVCALITGILMRLDFSTDPTLAAPSTAPESTPAPTQTKPTPTQTAPAPTETEPPPTETDPPATLPPETEPPEPTEPLPPEEIYTFRKTKTSDYSDPNDMQEWDIIITGVKVQQEVYYIPDSIPTSYGAENRVAGIATDAFKDSGAKVIYTSPYLKFIHYHAFLCNLTDLYISSDSVELNPYAYNSLKTLHTVPQATTGKLFINPVYFSEAAKSLYGAEWEEWEP